MIVGEEGLASVNKQYHSHAAHYQLGTQNYLETAYSQSSNNKSVGSSHNLWIPFLILTAGSATQ